MKKMKLRTKVILSLSMIILIAIAGVVSYTVHQLSKINTTEISKTDESLGITPRVPIEVTEKPTEGVQQEAEQQAPVQGNDITNIAFFGIDSRYKGEISRSDSIMIISLDEKHNKVKMSSIMRDTYVDIKGYGKTKINHAYAYGGPQLAMKTINENFNLDIRNYVTVDFFDLEKIIDSIGGVIIDVNKDEIEFLNMYIDEITSIEKKSVHLVTKPGTYNLNGLQAVAYSRIRYTTGGDFRRTERQRTVLSALFTKIQSLGLIEFPRVVSKLLPYTETSMSSMDILRLGKKVFVSHKMDLDQERFPVDGYCDGNIINGVWYLLANMKETTQHLHKYIYDDIKPIPKDPLF